MSSQPTPDRATSEEYLGRLTDGDEILYLKEAAALVRKPEGTMRVRGHEKVPTGGQVAVPSGGQ